MATWGVLLTETLRLLDDANSDRWSTAAIYGYLDNAYWEFQIRTELLRPDTAPNPVWLTLTLDDDKAGGTDHNAVYQITGGGGTTPIVGKILRMEDSRGTQLFETTEETLDNVKGPGWRLDTGKPRAYIRSKAKYDYVTLYPSPAGDSDGATLNVLCAILPAAIATDGTASGNSPALPTQYHQALPYGAAYRALYWNQDALSITLGKDYKARFDEFVAMAKADVERSFRK